MNKLITVCLMITVLVAAVVIVVRSSGKPPSAVPPAVVTTIQTNPAAPSETEPTSPARRLSPAVKDAVSAAVLANTSLSAAQLLPSDQLHSVVWNRVIPANRAATEKVYLASGRILTKIWGYQSLSEARVRSGYYVATQQYKVLRISRGQASIELYNFTHFRTTLDLDYDQEHWDASVTVIDLKKQAGRWLFADAHDPPVADKPPDQVGSSFEQTKDRLQPYLRGFSNYANLG